MNSAKFTNDLWQDTEVYSGTKVKKVHMINEVTRHEQLMGESKYSVNHTVLNSDHFTPGEIRFGTHLTESWMGLAAVANNKISLSILDTVLSFVMCVCVCVCFGNMYTCIYLCVLVFAVFCIVCTVVLYCFVHLHFIICFDCTSVKTTITG